MTAAVVEAGAANPQRLHVEICGAVQGVGFRPFVYRLATALGLHGWVRNSAQGVILEVEGAGVLLERFVTRLQTDMPDQASVQTLRLTWLAPAGYAQFVIQPSATQGCKTALILPDVATCADCLVEINAVANRRAGYPFTNCTNCGPRFSIVTALPYDRTHTTMRRFVLCPHCQAEYDAPQDRRFHAQPNACPTCGPSLTLCTPAGQILAREATALSLAIAALRQGQILAVKSLGGFHLMVDAGNVATIAQLRTRKQRPAKPFAIMVPTLEQVRQLGELPAGVERFLTAPAAPIVLLRRRPVAQVADNVAPGNPYIGVMLPYTPLHHLLLQDFGRPVVATSGNRSDEPLCTDEAELPQQLGSIADLCLVHNRPIARPVDDTVAWVVLDDLRLLRRARGYAPLPIVLRERIPTILAVGAHLKNSIALSLGQQVFVSQHIGDLATLQARQVFERVIADFLRLYEAEPVAVAHDLHPDYASTQWAQAWAGSQQLRLIPVQHHHAHLAACLADNNDFEPALGVTWDGTGYGPDGTVWGGEFLLGTAAAVTRVAHLRPFYLPGGDAAIRAPHRVALALLWELYGEAALARDDVASVRLLPATSRRVLGQMFAQQVNTPLTTSAGRLFDGIAALLGLCQQTTFEGEAAMALEFAAAPQGEDAYPMVLDGSIIDWRPCVEAILTDLRRGVAVGLMAARFHNAMVEAILAVVQNVGAARVALTGGCFQNRWLLERATRKLRALGCQVLLHRQVPPNDGGLSLGQVMVAAAQMTPTNH